MHFGCLSVFVSMYYVELLYLTVLVWWPDIVGVLWGTVTQPSWSSELVLQVHPLSELYASSCCSGALIAVGKSMERIDLRLIGFKDQLQLQQQSCYAGSTPQSRIHLSWALLPTKSASWVGCSWRWLGCALTWSEAVHWVRWLRGILGGAYQAQLPPVPCPGSPVMTTKTICRWCYLCQA